MTVGNPTDSGTQTRRDFKSSKGKHQAMSSKSKRNLEVQMPGETQAESIEPKAEPIETAIEPELVEVAPPAGDVMQPDPPPNPTLTADAQKDAQLAIEVAKTASLVGSDKALDWSHLTQPNIIQAKINPMAPDDGLPYAHEIDRSGIDRLWPARAH